VALKVTILFLKNEIMAITIMTIFHALTNIAAMDFTVFTRNGSA
jgi:hypothetical protein